VCGRFALGVPRKRLAEEFGLAEVPEAPDRYNIAPGQLVEAVAEASGGRREMRLLTWGLVPSWSRQGPAGRGFVNARIETAAEKPAFRAAMRYRRCLIPASGFYEWQARPGGRQPWFFVRKDGRVAALAGLWERYEGPGGEIVESCAILTTAADETVATVHERMPAAIEPADFGAWLDASMRDGVRAASIFRRRELSVWAGYPVGLGVNRVGVDGPDLVQPAPGAG
jgi:putative SOS response-associated peptidase YedK